MENFGSEATSLGGKRSAQTRFSGSEFEGSASHFSPELSTGESSVHLRSISVLSVQGIFCQREQGVTTLNGDGLSLRWDGLSLKWGRIEFERGRIEFFIHSSRTIKMGRIEFEMGRIEYVSPSYSK